MIDLHALHNSFGQSPWLDNLSRHFINDGTIERFIKHGVRGVTSNPTIFEKALTDGDTYDEAIKASGLTKEHAETLYWELAVEDIQHTADLLKPVFDESNHEDGYVSLEVSPELAQDATSTVTQARYLWHIIDRPNLMIKVPATEACLPAITELIADGFNLNVTLIFSLERYQQVMDAYMAGLEQRKEDISSIHSVASFFVSRVDTEIDSRLDSMGDSGTKLKGQAGLAQARLAYELFTQVFTPDNSRWSALAARGGNIQRPLWASTSVKNPDYDPLLYVKGLIARNTVNTLPNATLEAIESAPVNSLSNAGGVTPEHIQVAHELVSKLEAVGIHMSEVTALLEKEGVEKFHESFQTLLAAVAAKMPS